MIEIIGQTFDQGEVVEAEGKSFKNCIFNDCQIKGETKIKFVQCEFYGRAGDWMEKLMESSRLMTLHLNSGKIDMGPAFSREGKRAVE